MKVKGISQNIVFMVFACITAGTSHAENTLKTFSTEITYVRNDNILKFRPFYFKLPYETQQTHVMIGRNVKSLKVYGYWKSEDTGKSWFGLKTEYGTSMIADKLKFKLDLRYFYGLNDTAKEHYYFIPSAAYSFGKFSLGSLAYGKKTAGKDLKIYLSPLLNVNLTDHIRLQFFYGADIVNKSNQKLLYWKTTFDL